MNICKNLNRNTVLFRNPNGIRSLYRELDSNMLGLETCEVGTK